MEIWGWGSNNYGQLGLGHTNEQYDRPILVPNISSVADLATGGGHTMFIDHIGSLYGTGWNTKGQLGLSSIDQTIHSFRQICTKDIPRIRRVFCGWDFTMILTETGEVWASGSNAFGQLGINSKIPKLEKFEQVTDLKNRTIVDIACGLRHTVFIDNLGQVFVCGSSKKGQLGLGHGSPSIVSTPVLVEKIPKISAINAGQNFTVLKTEGESEVIVFGDNKYGQLGFDPQIEGPIIHESKRLTLNFAVDKIFCGWTHVLVLSKFSTLFTWGRNDYGQLGRNSCKSVQLISDIENIKFVQVSAGYEHTLAIDTSGNLFSWGWNEHGNCGTGTTQNILKPTIVNLENSRLAQKCFAGSGHSFVIVKTNNI